MTTTREDLDHLRSAMRWDYNQGEAFEAFAIKHLGLAVQVEPDAPAPAVEGG